jgi:hypothetical protein
MKPCTGRRSVKEDLFRDKKRHGGTEGVITDAPAVRSIKNVSDSMAWADMLSKEERPLFKI